MRCYKFSAISKKNSGRVVHNLNQETRQTSHERILAEILHRPFSIRTIQIYNQYYFNTF